MVVQTLKQGRSAKVISLHHGPAVYIASNLLHRRVFLARSIDCSVYRLASGFIVCCVPWIVRQPFRNLTQSQSRVGIGGCDLPEVCLVHVPIPKSPVYSPCRCNWCLVTTTCSLVSESPSSAMSTRILTGENLVSSFARHRQDTRCLVLAYKPPTSSGPQWRPQVSDVSGVVPGPTFNLPRALANLRLTLRVLTSAVRLTRE